MTNDLSDLFTKQMAVLQEELEKADAGKQRMFRRVIELQGDIIRSVIDSFIDMELSPEQIAVLSDHWLMSPAWTEIDNLREKLGLSQLRQEVAAIPVEDDDDEDETADDDYVSIPVDAEIAAAGEVSDEPVL